MASSQAQKTPYLAQFESQALYTANESQSFDFSFTKLPEASLRSLRSRKQRVALAKPDGIGGEPSPLWDAANVHGLAPPFPLYTLEYSPESSHFLGAHRQVSATN
jgi:hypothetical protein